MQISNLKTFLPFVIGYTAILVGAALHIFDFDCSIWIFGAGTLISIVVRSMSLKKTDDKRTRRLYGQLLIGALCLIATIYLMYTNSNSWAITLIISAIIDIWVSFRLK